MDFRLTASMGTVRRSFRGRMSPRPTKRAWGRIEATATCRVASAVLRMFRSLRVTGRARAGIHGDDGDIRPGRGHEGAPAPRLDAYRCPVPGEVGRGGFLPPLDRLD